MALLALALLLPAGEHSGEFAVPIVTSVSRRSFAVEGPWALTSAEPLLVTGYGLAAGYAGSRPSCRISPLGGEAAFVHVSGYLNDPRSVIEFNATVVSGSQTCSPPCYVAPNNRSCCESVLRCSAPPGVIAPGPGTLSVRNNVGWSLEPQAVEYAFLIDVALDRRPYISETQGRLLLKCNASLVGMSGVRIAATIPTLPAAATAAWRWEEVRLNSSTILTFDLSSLPATVNTDIEIRITGGSAGLNITKYRRFMRASPPVGAVEAVQVDHSTRAIVVGGKPFGLGSGWYMDGNEERQWMGNITNYAAAMARQASLGDSWVLPYGLSSKFTASEQREFTRSLPLLVIYGQIFDRLLVIAGWFLDRCADQGVKVMVPLASTVGSNVRNLDPVIANSQVRILSHFLELFNRNVDPSPPP